MGFGLLALRLGTFESDMYKKMHANTKIKKGNFLLLFKKRKLFYKYISCIIVGIPIWFVVGVLVVLSDRFASAFGVSDVSVADNVMYCYVGLSVGDMLAGLLSQFTRSRKKIIYIYLFANLVLLCFYLFNTHYISAVYFKWMSFLLGTCIGYWGLFVTIASEQFGTNIRSTVTNTVPNFIRGSVPPITITFVLLVDFWGEV